MLDSSATALCDACVQLGALTQTTYAHSTLLEQATAQPLLDDSVERRFRCADCGTVWLRRTDKWGTYGTFRLAPNTPT